MLDSCCSDIIYGKGPTSTLLDSSRLTVWMLDGRYSDIIYSKSVYRNWLTCFNFLSLVLIRLDIN